VNQEHKKCHGLDELQAKFRYVQLCRSLKTYGVTFFLVKVGEFFFILNTLSSCQF
jgi:talin